MQAASLETNFIRSSVTGDRYRWKLHPREQCESMIASRMRNFRCSWVARSCKNLDSFYNMVLIYSKPPLESQTLSTAVSSDKWLLLNGVVPRRYASLVVSLSANFIPLNKELLYATVLSLSIRSLDKINRLYREKWMVCVCARQKNESHFVTANSGCGQQYKHFKQAIQSAMVQCRNTEPH